jgi:hypothetical protein
VLQTLKLVPFVSTLVMVYIRGVTIARHVIKIQTADQSRGSERIGLTRHARGVIQTGQKGQPHARVVTNKVIPSLYYMKFPKLLFVVF